MGLTVTVYGGRLVAVGVRGAQLCGARLGRRLRTFFEFQIEPKPVITY